MFKPIANPYIVGNPIKTADMFFGRQDDFDFIKRKLETGEKSYIIVLCGERRSGKTSILFQILSGRLGEDFIPILVDMQTMAGLKNEREFFEKFAQETLKYIRQKIDINEYFKSQDSSFKAFAAFLDAIHKQNQGKHILFLIDEYELIEAKINEGSLNENFIPFLAGLLEGEQLISFIFTGSTKLEERKAKMWQLLFAKSLFRNVSYLSRDDTLRLIQEPVFGNINFDLVVLNVIYRLTSGQPFYTQVVCQNIVDYVNQKQQTTIQEEDLDIIVNEILENPLPQMIYFWNSQSDDRKLVLSLMAELLDDPNAWINAEQIIRESKQRKFGLDLSVKSINMTLESLYHSQHLSKSQAGYKFQMDLFRRWIKRDHAIWRVMKEVSTLGMASSVEKQVFDKEESAGQKSPPIWIYAVVVVVVLAVSGWYFFWPSGDEVKSQADSMEQGNVPPETDDGTRGVAEANIEKDQPAETSDNEQAPQKKAALVDEKAEQKSSEAPPKKVVSKPQTRNTPQKAAKEPALDLAAKRNAENARDAMSSARDKAAQVKADQQASAIFSRAENKKTEAEARFAAADFSQANTLFTEAAALYTKATGDVSKMAQSRSIAESAKQTMLSAKNTLSNPQKKMPSYQSAQNKEEQADRFFSSNNFTQASENYNAAAKDYKNAIREYQENEKNVTNLINAYLDAIENESIAQMKRDHINFTKDLESSWQQYFKAADNIRVIRKIKSLDFSSQNATADVEVQLSFSGAENSPLNNWLFKLEKTSSKWVISEITEGN